jgi:Predicted permease
VSNAAAQVWVALQDAFLMAWEVWWALVLGFFISAIVQAWVPRERIETKLAGDGPRPLAWATGLGAASSSCSYAAIAIAKSLFQKGSRAEAAGLVVRSVTDGDARVVGVRLTSRGEDRLQTGLIAIRAERQQLLEHLDRARRHLSDQPGDVCEP